MPGPNPILFIVADLYGNAVFMRASTWEHITDHHPEMTDQLTAVRTTIQDPDGWRASSIRNTARVWETFGTGPASGGIRVLVNDDNNDPENGGGRGSVMTAYPQDPDCHSRVGPLHLVEKGREEES